jgi:multimeric flavodoxin WrbA
VDIRSHDKPPRNFLSEHVGCHERDDPAGIPSSIVHFLAISGSEHSHGSTDQALELVKQQVESLGGTINIIALRDYRVEMCGQCGDCNMRTSRCDIDDDSSRLLDLMLKADCIIYAAPVHGFGMPTLMQKFIERMGVGYLRFERPLTNKIGGILVVGGRYSHDAVFAQLVKNIFLNRMILVGSGFPAFFNARTPDDIMKDREGIDSLFRMVARMYGMACCLNQVKSTPHHNFLAPTFGNERSFVESNSPS